MERLKKNLILALVLGVAVYLVLAVFSGFSALRDALESFEWALLPAIFGIVAVSYVGRYFRWLYFLRILKISIPHRINIPIFASGLSMAISPGKLGEVLKSVFIKRVSGDPIARTAPIVLAERATDATGMVIWGAIGALTFSFGLRVLVIFVVITALGIAVLRSKKLSLLAERVLSKLPVLNRLAPHLHDFHASSNDLLAMGPLAIGTIFSFVSWGMECTAVYLCSVGFGAGRPFLEIVFIFVVSSLVGVASMMPGGLGVAEAGLAGMFKTISGLAGGTAVALTFVIRLATLWFATLLGILSLMIVRGMLGDVGEESIPTTGTQPPPR